MSELPSLSSGLGRAEPLQDAASLLALLEAWVDKGWLRALDQALVTFFHELDEGSPPLVLLAAALATAFDFLLEPVAVRLDYWRWRDGVIPLQNYVAWFLTAGLVAILHPRLERSRCELGTQGRLAGYFLATQAGFFALLRFGWWWQGF